jgi:hypothetical protein
MKIKKFRIVLAVVCIILIIGLIPFPTESVPEWKVTAVDRQGNPLSGIELVEEWRFSNTLPMSREAKITDENGEVTFPARTFISPIFIRIILFVFDWLNLLLDMALQKVVTQPLIVKIQVI